MRNPTIENEVKESSTYDGLSYKYEDLLWFSTDFEAKESFELLSSLEWLPSLSLITIEKSSYLIESYVNCNAFHPHGRGPSSAGIVCHPNLKAYVARRPHELSA